jgi:hypothetical protein
MELVAEFVILAGKAALAKLIAGKQPSRSDLANVSTQVADILLAHTSAEESALARMEKRLAEQPLQDYNTHLAAGHRHLRDLPREWRSPEDKRDIIRAARDEFVSAAAVARVARDPYREAFAEAAIAGCWLWVPSLPDAQKTFTDARMILAGALLDLDLGDGVVGAEWASVLAQRAALTNAYRGMLRACRAYGTLSSDEVDPVDLSSDAQFSIGVRAPKGRVVNCLGIRVTVLSASSVARFKELGRTSSRRVKVAFAVENTSWRPSVRLSLGMPSAPSTETLDQKAIRHVRRRLTRTAPAPSARRERESQVPIGSSTNEVLQAIGPPMARWIAIVAQPPWPRGTARIAFIVRPLAGP